VGKGPRKNVEIRETGGLKPPRKLRAHIEKYRALAITEKNGKSLVRGGRNVWSIPMPRRTTINVVSKRWGNGEEAQGCRFCGTALLEEYKTALQGLRSFNRHRMRKIRFLACFFSPLRLEVAASVPRQSPIQPQARPPLRSKQGLASSRSRRRRARGKCLHNCPPPGGGCGPGPQAGRRRSKDYRRKGEVCTMRGRCKFPATTFSNGWGPGGKENHLRGNLMYRAEAGSTALGPGLQGWLHTTRQRGRVLGKKQTASPLCDGCWTEDGRTGVVKRAGR